VLGVLKLLLKARRGLVFRKVERSATGLRFLREQFGFTQKEFSLLAYESPQRALMSAYERGTAGVMPGRRWDALVRGLASVEKRERKGVDAGIEDVRKVVLAS
jgi:hypothetical protein